MKGFPPKFAQSFGGILLQIDGEPPRYLIHYISRRGSKGFGGNHVSFSGNELASAGSMGCGDWRIGEISPKGLLRSLVGCTAHEYGPPRCISNRFSAETQGASADIGFPLADSMGDEGWWLERISANLFVNPWVVIMVIQWQTSEVPPTFSPPNLRVLRRTSRRTLVNSIKIMHYLSQF